MIQLLLHLIGDYLLQTDWMAKYKKQKGVDGLLACLTHCTLYSLMFFYVGNYQQVVFIFITHFLIDRYYFIKWYMNTFDMKEFSKEPFSPWSIVIIDNTFHLLCNFVILEYL